LSASADRHGPRRAGRPRDAAIEHTVLRAAIELIRERARGADFTMGEVVERSGVSRAAIYRRWENRKALIVAALDIGRQPVESIQDRLPISLVFAGLPAAVSDLLNEGVATFLRRADKIDLHAAAVRDVEASFTATFAQQASPSFRT
jgi:AcrR family transcriptional regulator